MGALNGVFLRIFSFWCAWAVFLEVLVVSPVVRAQTFPAAVVWSEAGLPVADSAAPSAVQLGQVFPGAHLVVTDRLGAELANPQTRLLILPQGSAVPEAAWPGIFNFLRHGGNLLALGGRPFTRAAYHDGTGWHLREYSVRFIRPLLIDQYQTTPGSAGETFTPNPEIPVGLADFSWKQAFSPIVHLSTNALYHRGGTTGTLDVRLDTLVWGIADGRKLSAPILQFDHLSSGFDGGRWIFVAAELTPNFYSAAGSVKLLRTLAERAMRGAEEFSVRPTMPLYLPGEPIELETIFSSNGKSAGPLTVQISSYPEAQPAQRQSIAMTLPANTTAVLPAATSKGLYVIEARLLEGNAIRAIYHSAFWIRDEAFLRSGPRFGVNADYLTIDEKPLAVVGTTYMSSEVQRLYFDHPNVYVWNSDLGLIHSAGLNMIRTGWWTGWDKLCDETGRPYERTLRTLEAYLMTARKYGLPVQFNFFAFLPEVLGGSNAYLDPQAVRKQQTLLRSVASRFRDVPYLAWDLINEPSFSNHLWTMRPNEDGWELAAWNAWLAQKYPDRAALAAAWNLPTDAISGTVSLPSNDEFSSRGIYSGVNSLRVYDFCLFAQETFAEWVHGMREAIRTAGAAQPITVGQDEGGYIDRLSPAFFSQHVDFTTNHSWWQNDFLLWDSLVAKQPGKALLIQETGLQRELNMDETARRTPDQEAMLFERKVAMSFVQGSGAIEWLWNTNSYMADGNETPIGALHADGTEKPEATVLRNFAKFAVLASPYLKNPKAPEVVVLTSQAAQFSVQGDLQIAAQQNAVRALGYYLHQPVSLLAENQIAKLGTPKLVILPSAQSLRESTWQALLGYVRSGGTLLVSGPVSRDEHWQKVDRLTPLTLQGTVEPLTAHTAGLDSPGGPSITFNLQKQQLLEYLNFGKGVSDKELNLGSGKLIWLAYPVELAQSEDCSAREYRKVLQRLGIASPYSTGQPLPPGILIYPIDLENSVLYVMESEWDQDANVSLHDSASGGDLVLGLPAQRAALAIIDKKTKRIVAKYGF
jgi:hypothetical protein